MIHQNQLIDLEYESKFLGDLISNEAPEEKINEEFDRLCLIYFDYTRHELTDKVPNGVLNGLDDWYYDEIIDLGERHGFDFSEKSGSRSEFVSQKYFYVIGQWEYFAEMLIAKECGYFPSSPEEVALVKLNREAKRYKQSALRQRQQPRVVDQERDKVFGTTSRHLKPGTIVAPHPRNKGGKGIREISIEVRGRDKRTSREPSGRG